MATLPFARINPFPTMTIIPFLILALGCGGGDDDGTGPATSDPLEPANLLSASDLANFGDGRDLEVIFQRAPIGPAPSGHRVFVHKASAGTLDVATAAGLGASRYVTAPSQSAAVRLRMDGLGGDTDGDALAEGVAYQVYVLSLPTGDGDPVLSIPRSVTLEQIDVLVTLTDDIAAGAGGLEVDAQGRIYTGDFGPVINQADGDRIYRVTPDGDVSTFVEGMVGASGNAFDADGNLLQANVGLGSVVRISPSGGVETVADGFQTPIGVAVAENGDIFVNNCSGARISRIAADGTVSTFAQSTLLNCPNGLTLAGDGNFYVSNFSDANVLKITPSGDVSVFATMPGSSNAHILWGNDGLYVVGRDVPRIYRLELDGSFEAIAGTGSRGNTDGNALDATLALPNDIALSPDGSILYINDVPGGNPSNGLVNPTVIRALIFANQ